MVVEKLRSSLSSAIETSAVRATPSGSSVGSFVALWLIGCMGTLGEGGGSSDPTHNPTPPTLSPPSTAPDGGASPSTTGDAGTPPGAEPPLPEGAGTLRIESYRDRTAGVAPAGFFFSAKASDFGVDDHYSDVHYRWRFDDPGHYTRHETNDIPWDRVYDVDGTHYVVRGPMVYHADGVTLHPSAAVLQPGVGFRPNFGRVRTYLGPDRNIAYGPHVAHVFGAPGTYNVTCEARVRGRAPVTRRITITVRDPNEVFAGSDTIVWAPNNDFTGAPDGAQRVTTEDAAIAALTSGDSRRLLIRRGTQYSLPRDIGRSGGWQNLQIGAFGPGKPPYRVNQFVRMPNENPDGPKRMGSTSTTVCSST